MTRRTVPSWEYRGKWGLVTGASAGIGAVLAARLAERGMNLVLTARRVERLNELGDRLVERHGIQVEVIPEDLLSEGAARRLWAAATEARSPAAHDQGSGEAPARPHRTIDLLVNNAGFGARGRFHEVPLDRHLQILRLNATVVMELTHLALREMRARRRGGIINVSSISAFQPVPQLASYAASKAFVLSLTQAIWAENADAGVRVVALCPGRTPTEFQAVAGTGSAEGTFGYRTPEQVVDAGLRALERGRPVEIPGFENRAAAWAVRALPGTAIVRVMRSVVRLFWKQEQPPADRAIDNTPAEG